MKASLLILPAFLVLAAVSARAQCGSSRGGGHTAHGVAQGRGDHQEMDPRQSRATNTICPAMGQPVNPGRDREVVIRGNYYLVCCGGCGPELAENYDKYFDKEGRPLNDPKREGKTPAREAERPTPAAPPAHEGHQH